EYRPAAHRGDLEIARALAATRAPFEPSSALVESGDCGLREQFAEQEARADLQAEMAGLDWFLGVVDLRLLLAFQRRIILDSGAPVPDPNDWVGRMDLCFGKPEPIVCDAIRSDSSVVFR
ncbi:MAG: hypothetical protein WCC95_18810, partial [Candidatus Sulfotelmatobacter sp.]